MAEFTYQVRGEGGQMSSGVLTAGDVAEATRQLRRDGVSIVSLDERKAAFRPHLKRIHSDDVIYFTNQLAVMVDTGVPLSEALDAICSQTDHPGMKAVIDDISSQVKSGTEFSVALECHPKIFSRLFMSLMKASEASGTMGQMLQRVSEYMKEEREVHKQVKGAMVYPACMLVFCIMVVTALLIFVLPRFEKIYAGKGAVLPAPTRILLSMSRTLVAYWPLFLVGVVGGIVALVMYSRSEGGRRLRDKIRISMPVLGTMYRKSCIARSMRTMATMVGSGVSILDGLEITAQVAGNVYYSQIWRELASRVQEGSTLAEQLRSAPLMPASVAQMVSAGERTGKLSTVMNRIAEFCEDDLRSSVKAATSLIEPAMIIVMGLVIGGIAMALLLPVFQIAKVVAH